MNEKPIFEELGQALDNAILTLSHLLNHSMLDSNSKQECYIVRQELEKIEQRLYGKPS